MRVEAIWLGFDHEGVGEPALVVREPCPESAFILTSAAKTGLKSDY